MKGLVVGATMALVLSGCVAGGPQEGASAAFAPAAPSEGDRLLIESAPEVALTALAEAAEVCRMQLVTGTRIPRLQCELMSPSEAALVEMQTEDEIEYAREQQLLDEELRIEASFGQAGRRW